jgi:hypothetical protein
MLDDLKEKREYCKVKEEALDWIVWRICFGRGYGPVVRQTMQKYVVFNPHCGPG